MIIVVCIIIAIVLISVIVASTNSQAEENKLRNIQLQDNTNRGILNSLCDRLESYDEISAEDLVAFPNEIDNIDNVHDKEIIEAAFDALFYRHLPVLPKNDLCDIMLKPNETLFFKRINNINIGLSRLKNISKTIYGSGVRYSNGGIRSFAYNVQTIPHEQMTVIENNGKLYVTDKRIIYITPKNKTYTILISNILDFTIDRDSIIITVDNAQPYKFTVTDNFEYLYSNEYGGGIVLDTVYGIAKAIQTAKQN